MAAFTHVRSAIGTPRPLSLSMKVGLATSSFRPLIKVNDKTVIEGKLETS